MNAIVDRTSSSPAAGDDPSHAPLRMLRLHVDPVALASWAFGTGQRALRDDAGYAAHAALRATLGDHAPKPFALVERRAGMQLVGYCRGDEADVRRALELAVTSEPSAAAALGIGVRERSPDLRPMPSDWRTGETLGFELRVAPVVRSRTAGEDGRIREVDAAYHDAFAGESRGDRDAAHRAWLSRQFGRGGACTLLESRPVAFRLAPIARRARIASGSDDDAGRSGGRATRSGLLPDLLVRGLLRIDDPGAFHALLARGVGRHRSFGYGCLLIAPPNAWR